MFLCCYEGEGQGEGQGDGSKTFTQDQVNAILKKEKEKEKAARDKLIKDLEALQTNSKTSEESKAALEAQLNELRQSHLSESEKAALQHKRMVDELTGKLTGTEQSLKDWQTRHHNLMVGYEISSGFASQDLLPGASKFVEAHLRPLSRVVEVLGDDGKPTGAHKVVVKMTIAGKDGKPVELDMSVPEAAKAMKDDVDNFGMLFKSTANGGVGGNSGQGGKQVDYSKAPMEQYMAARSKGQLPHQKK